MVHLAAMSQREHANTSRNLFPQNLPDVRTGYCFDCQAELPQGIFSEDGALPIEYTCTNCTVTNRRMLIWDPILKQYFNEDGYLVHESAGMILINQNNEILLFFRSKFPSAYTIPAGHVDEGEDMQSAAIREVLEETGIAVVDVKLLKETTVIGDSCSRGADIHKWHLYASRANEKKVELADEGEHYAWFSLTSLPDDLTVITKAFLNDTEVFAKLKEI